LIDLMAQKVAGRLVFLTDDLWPMEPEEKRRFRLMRSRAEKELESWEPTLKVLREQVRSQMGKR